MAIDTSLHEGRDRLRTLLLKLSVRTDRVFRLASGRESNFYIDVKKTSLDAEGAFWIGRLFAETLQNEFPDVQAVGGPTLGADPLTSSTQVVAWSLGRRLTGFIVRKNVKEHGTGNWIEGPALAPGTPVAVTEDVVTTGGSALEGIERLREAGLDVRVVLAVVDRQEGGRERIEAAGYPVRSLFGKSDLVD
jgi:orotate phosphoribosyltransferase